jgi:hypothetical protein
VSGRSRRTIARVLLLGAAILILLGTFVSLGAWLAGRSLTAPLVALAAGGVLLVATGGLLRDARVVCELLLGALSLPLLLFGLGLLFQTLGGRSNGHLALALVLLLAGAGGAFMARALLRSHRAG